MARCSIGTASSRRCNCSRESPHTVRRRASSGLALTKRQQRGDGPLVVASGIVRGSEVVEQRRIARRKLQRRLELDNRVRKPAFGARTHGAHFTPLPRIGKRLDPLEHREGELRGGPRAPITRFRVSSGKRRDQRGSIPAGAKFAQRPAASRTQRPKAFLEHVRSPPSQRDPSARRFERQNHEC